MDGPEIVQGLIARGYSPVHAAALAGHALQESGGNPTAFNPKEDAHGILQWRNDRWAGLQALAKARGTTPDDPQVQLDFIGQEMAGPEAKAGTAFRSTTDLPTASAALKKYIRFGDNSDEARLNNARGLLGAPNVGMINPQATPALPQTPASSVAGSTLQPGTPAAAPADDGNAALMAQLANIPKLLQAQQQNQVFAPAAAPPDNLRARMAAIAAARQGQASV